MKSTTHCTPAHQSFTTPSQFSHGLLTMEEHGEVVLDVAVVAFVDVHQARGEGNGKFS